MGARKHLTLAIGFVTVVGWALAASCPAYAQFNRSSRTSTSGLSPLSSSGMQSSATGPFGTRTFGQGMNARSSTGGLTGGGSSLASGLSGLSNMGSRTGTGMQAGRQAGQFVGADTRDIRNLLGFVTNPQQGTQAWRSGLSGMRTRTVEQPTQTGGRGGGRGTNAEVPAVIQLGFDFQPIAAPTLETTLQQRLERSGAIRSVEGVSVAVEGDTVVLRGTVGSDYERLLAENLARLEPGVRQVRNELKISTELPSANSTGRASESNAEAP